MAKKQTEEQVQEVIEAEPKPLGVCGHVNKHFINVDGEPENLYCDLQKGHAGNHEANYQGLRQRDGTIKDARVKDFVVIGGKEMIIKTLRAEWSDGAGIPANEIEPDLKQLAYIRANKAEFILAENLARKQ